MNDRSADKELFEYIRSADIPKLPPLKDILSHYKTESVCVDEVIQKIRKGRDGILLIDARSEKEFIESPLPGALNFPVLSNSERHKVGLIYKKYSQTSALWLAMGFAEPKSSGLKEFLNGNDASSKKIVVYCWRGGGRSGYLAKMISDLGYPVSVIKGGHKSYRNSVNNFFSAPEFPSSLIELSGLTGSGKTELLRKASAKVPAIDLEKCARHYSSLLGRIPYEIRSIPPVANQSAFENSLFAEISTNCSGASLSQETFLIESESRKVGDFCIPEILLAKMNNAPSVRIESSLESRVKRLNTDYFGEDMRGITPVIRIMKEKEQFFRQQLSSKTFYELMADLENANISRFTEVMLVRYYDVKYKDKGKRPVETVDADLADAGEQLVNIYHKIAARSL